MQPASPRGERDDRLLDETHAPLDSPDLQAVLEAWGVATERLRFSHEALREQVRRLSDELEAKNRELRRKNRLADLGQVASHVAHEVRNGLVPITLYLSLLRRRISEDHGSIDILNKVIGGITEMDATVNDLLDFATDKPPQFGAVSVLSLVEDMCEQLAPQLSAQGVQLTVDVPEGVSVRADTGMLRRAVLNLILNALDAMPDGGELVITGVDYEKSVELEIADSGPGLAPSAIKRVFEPFFTTKSHGAGLGLAIVYHILERHQGTVFALNCPEGGAAFTLRLPRAAAQCQEARVA